MLHPGRKLSCIQGIAKVSRFITGERRANESSGTWAYSVPSTPSFGYTVHGLSQRVCQASGWGHRSDRLRLPGDSISTTMWGRTGVSWSRQNSNSSGNQLFTSVLQLMYHSGKMSTDSYELSILLKLLPCSFLLQKLACQKKRKNIV